MVKKNINIFLKDIYDPYFWTVKSTKMLIGDQVSNVCTETDPCFLVIDSGTSVITGPTLKLMEISTYLPWECAD